MTQKIVVELSDEETISQQEASQIGSLIRSLAETEDGISSLKLEIESASVLEIPLAGVSMEETAEEAELEEMEPENEEPIEAAEPVQEEPEIEGVESEEEAETEVEPALNPGTRRWILASLLHNTDGPLTVKEIVDVSEGEEWGMGQSGASAELYNMFEDGLVDRSGSPYAYELTDDGSDLLVQRSSEEPAEIEPNPFSGNH